MGPPPPPDPPGGPNPPHPPAPPILPQCPLGPPALTFNHKLRGSDIPRWDGAHDGYKPIQWISECQAWEALGGSIPNQLGQRLAMNFKGMARMRWLMLLMDCQGQVHWAASLPLLLYWCLHVYLGDQFLMAQRLRYFKMQYQQGEF